MDLLTIWADYPKLMKLIHQNQSTPWQLFRRLTHIRQFTCAQELRLPGEAHLFSGAPLLYTDTPFLGKFMRSWCCFPALIPGKITVRDVVVRNSCKNVTWLNNH